MTLSPSAASRQQCANNVPDQTLPTGAQMGANTLAAYTWAWKWQPCKSELSMALALTCAPLGVGPKTWPSLYSSRVACTQWCGHSWGFPFIVNNDTLTRMMLVFVNSISSVADTCFRRVTCSTLTVALIRLVLLHSLGISWFVSRMCWCLCYIMRLSDYDTTNSKLLS